MGSGVCCSPRPVHFSDDILQAVRKLQKLGSGYQVITVGNKTLIQVCGWHGRFSVSFRDHRCPKSYILASSCPSGLHSINHSRCRWSCRLITTPSWRWLWYVP